VQAKSAASETAAAKAATHQAPGESIAPTEKSKVNALTPTIIFMAKMLAGACDAKEGVRPLFLRFAKKVV
jgi:hypothetical protein